MKHLKMLSLAAIAAMALIVIGAGTASATALYKTGNVKMVAGDSVVASLETDWTADLASTAGDPIATCTESSVSGEITNPGGAGTNVIGRVNHLTFSGGCTVTVDQGKNGTLSIERIGSTTSGTVRGIGFFVTVHSPFVGECNYGLEANADLGTLTGSTNGSATMNIEAIVREQEPNRVLCPDTTRWIAVYDVTTPANKWVEAS